MVVKDGALKISKLLKIYIIYIMISLDRLITWEKKYPYMYKWHTCFCWPTWSLFKTEPANNPDSVKMDISWTLSDLYLQEWNEIANVSSKGKQYFLFKDNLNFEKYLIKVSKFCYTKIIKYRTGNHQLPIEAGRWTGISLNKRKCNICTTNDTGDEYHYLCTCDFLRVTENYIWNCFLC